MPKSNPHKLPIPLFIAKNIEKIRKEDERGLLYFLEYDTNYYRLEKYLDKMTAPACSTFTVNDRDGNRLLCRNYDFSHYRFNNKTTPDEITGLDIVVYCKNRKAKYKSIGVVDGFWLDFAKGRYFEGALTDGSTDISRLAMAPLVIMDGANEAGLGVSIMHLPTENDWRPIEYREPDSLSDKEKETAVILEAPGEEPKRLDYQIQNGAIAINTADKKAWTAYKDFAAWQKEKGKAWKADKNSSTHQREPGKKEIYHPVLMRRMLDFCANVDEAIEMARSYNVKSPLPDNDYHILLADKGGRTVILEWVDNRLNVQDLVHCTNYYKTRPDGYGYGQDRDEIAAGLIEESGGVMSREEAMTALARVAQDCRCGKFVGFTQWSNVYNLSDNSMTLAIFNDYGHIYEYKI